MLFLEVHPPGFQVNNRKRFLKGSMSHRISSVRGRENINNCTLAPVALSTSTLPHPPSNGVSSCTWHLFGSSVFIIPQAARVWWIYYWHTGMFDLRGVWLWALPGIATNRSALPSSVTPPKPHTEACVHLDVHVSAQHFTEIWTHG